MFDCRAWLTLKIKKLDVIPRPLNNEQVVIKVRQHSYQWHSVPVIRHFGQRRLDIKQALLLQLQYDEVELHKNGP